MAASPLVLRVALMLGLLGTPVAPKAQEAGRVYRVGYLQTATREVQTHLIKAFEDGLRDLGWVVGRTVVIEYRFADGKPERLPQLARELVDLKVDLIVTGVNLNTIAARQATTTVPIVMAFGHDPVGVGLVASLARPGGNITGLAVDIGDEILGKRLELLKEVVASMSRVAVLWNPSQAFNVPQLRAMEAPARALGMTLVPIAWLDPVDLEGAFGTMVRERVGGIVVLDGPLPYGQRALISTLASRYRLPLIAGYREVPMAGALMSYGPDVADNFRRTAGYVDRILKGAKPAELPVEQPTKFELVLNARTAKALGLPIPPSVMARVDEVVE